MCVNNVLGLTQTWEKTESLHFQIQPSYPSSVLIKLCARVKRKWPFSICNSETEGKYERN